MLGSLPASFLGWALYRRKLGNRATEPSQLKVKYRDTVAQESCSPKDQMSLRHKCKEYASFFLELLEIWVFLLLTTAGFPAKN